MEAVREATSLDSVDGQSGSNASRLVPLGFQYSLAEPLSPRSAVGSCKLYL